MRAFTTILLVVGTLSGVTFGTEVEQRLKNSGFVRRKGRSLRDHGGADAAALGKNGVDLHGKFCVDISEYGPVEYRDAEDKECCTTTITKKCEPVEDQVCATVTEMECKVHPYTECTMVMESKPFLTDVFRFENFTQTKCDHSTDIVKHTKLRPNCVDRTSENCVQVWKTLADGRKVREKTNDCKTVTWRDCSLQEYEQDFEVPKVDCKPVREIPYQTCVKEEKEFMLNRLDCKVKSTANCEPVQVTKCASIKYMKCAEVPTKTCNGVTVREPYQELDHKEWCLFPNEDEGTPVDVSFGSASPNHDSHHHDHSNNQDEHDHHEHHPEDSSDNVSALAEIVEDVASRIDKSISVEKDDFEPLF